MRFRFCRFSLGLLLASVLQAAPASAPPLPIAVPAAVGLDATRLDRLHRFMQAQIDTGHYLGAVTMIARHGRLADVSIHGYRNLARTEPLAPDTIFRIYSMTKAITSVAAMILMEEGRLGLEDPVAKYLTEFAAPRVLVGGTADNPKLAPAASPMTIRQLLTHTAGFTRPDAIKGGEVGELYLRADLGAATSLADYTRRLARLPLADQPGTAFHYGTSTDVLGRVIEVVSGQPFERFLQERIFQPLGLRDTSFTVTPAERHRIAQMTTSDDAGVLRPHPVETTIVPGEMLNSFPSGAGGLYSTPNDYLRFCQMILNGGSLDDVKILGRKTVELMRQNHLTQLNPPVHEFSRAEGFGLGWYVVLDVARRGRPGSVGQFGWSGAGSTYFTIDPQEDLIALLFMQHLPQDPHKINGTFYTLVYQALD